MADVNLDDPAAWQYELPPELIASRPAARRDDARLLMVERSSGRISHLTVRDLPEILNRDDLLVFNNTRVLPARLFGTRTDTGGRWEGLFLRELPDGRWELLCETRGKLQPGETITVRPAASQVSEGSGAPPRDPELLLTLESKDDEARWTARPSADGPVTEILSRFGSMPLPPYMGRKLADSADEERYQTVYATQPGAVAAPTAGLHFTPELLESCRNAGVRTTDVTLHVGIGTFRPMNSARVSEHRMHSEWCSLPQSTCQEIASTRAAQGRIVAVGTTSVRTLESAALAMPEELAGWQGETNLFIRPPWSFQLTDCLLTNFHLPGSTLLVMVAALAGYELVMDAYRAAIEQRYRFYSYGDAMLIIE